MKKLFFTLAILASGLTFGQNIEPKLEAVGKLVKATYYYDNGKVQQEGFFNDGKLDGKWISYDETGNLKVVAEYTNGAKSGKWIYYSDSVAINEVTYIDNKIATVTNVKPTTIADKN